mmetsp:Transcript_41224/g.66855  ORF Transcript_41224/g.66855 Transcript_41224/m.66855 type:complete len:417 (+) Transcript_41224:279-1529(+)|eukprot:CAMPEP_0184668462 /NCGR_PEP_ID=MMETSP0308-20130426/72470_1 /TAXON_ID=38269 /ORGANISM="Gloeochaete witrockiana, Strain SAG 46.84" /LENGTH=416 /DNA_ID=CAMNT_0027114209 /DNA_START=169 /DNA_END=1419 /DNA_ORIENTATION=+
MLDLSITSSVTEGPWRKRFRTFDALYLLAIHVGALYGYLNTPKVEPATFMLSVFYFFFSGLGITAGYHRYWSHKSYDAILPMEILLMLMGTSGGQGSIIWWTRDHRAHHRFVDTYRDPYNAKAGLFYSHIGWVLLRQDPQKRGKVDVSDLKEDPVVCFQRDHYFLLFVLMAFVFPTVVAGLGWGDWWGGFFIAGLVRMVVYMECVYCINSLGHAFGDQPYDDKKTPRDSLLAAIITFGDGYHNFHHEFPQDYRAGIKALQYDPTKWFIYTCSWLGLTYNLQMFDSNEIRKSHFQMKAKKLEEEKQMITWAPEPATLPIMTWQQVQAQSRSVENVKLAGVEGDVSKKLRDLVVVDGVVHDVSDFTATHPGGRQILESMIGKDVSAAFKGGIYKHTNAAHNLLSNMRIARLAAGQEEE